MGGTRLAVDRNRSASGCHPQTFDCMKRFGILCVDLLTDEIAWASVYFPIPQVGAPLRERYGWMDYMRPTEWAKLARSHGAAVYNLNEGD